MKKYNIQQQNIRQKLSKKDRMVIILIAALMVMIMLKQVISTYLFSALTLIPSIVVFVWFFIRAFQKKISIKKYDWFFGIMILSGTVSGLMYKQNIVAIAYQIKSLSIYYILFMIIRNINFKDGQIKLLLNYINFATIVLVFLSIIEILFQKNYIFPIEWSKEIVYADNYIRAYSMICNPNVYGFYLLIVILFNYNYKNEKFNKIDILKYSLYIVGLFLTVSRSALICLIFLMLLYAFALFKNRKRKEIFKNHLISLLAVIIISTITVVSIYGVNKVYKNFLAKSEITDAIEENKITNENFNDRISSMWESDFVSKSLDNGRIAVINYGLKKLKKNVLLGTGFSSFLSASSFLNPNEEADKLGLEYSDNQYISILVESGLFGMINLIVLFILVVMEQYKKKEYISFISSFIIAFFGLFINVLEVQLISYLFFLFIGLNMNKEI